MSTAILPNPFDTCPCRFERRRCPPGAQHSSRHSYFKTARGMSYTHICMKKALLVFACAAFLSGAACQSASAPNNANSAAGKTNGNVNIDPNNMPAGLSTAPVTPGGTPTPGIPDPVNANRTHVPGATPTPGIPPPDQLGKPLPKGATPTPGIPDSATIKRQLNSTSNVNMQAPPPPGADKGPVTSGDSRMRKVGNKKP